MKRTMLALAVVAVTLPGLALAAEPVPMTDNELDTVAAGASISSLTQAIAAIRAHPADFQAQIAKNPVVYSQNEATIRRLLPHDLHYLLPK